MKTSAWWWVAALLVAGGCKEEIDGGSAGDGDADADSDGDSDSDADGDADSDSVPVRVYTQDRRGTRQPAPGALVAFDLPSGARVEQTADADGRTTFANVDWSGGDTAAVIAHLDGWQLGGITAMTEPYVASILEATGELMVVLGVNPESRDGLVEVSGEARMFDVNHMLSVGASGAGWSHQEQGPAWSILVEPDEPFTIVGVEWPTNMWADPFVQPLSGWTLLAHQGVDAPTRAELDFVTDSVAPIAFSGSLQQPEDTIGSFFRHAGPYVALGSLEGWGVFSYTLTFGSRPGYGGSGTVTLVDGRDAPTWSYEGEYVEVDAISAPATLVFWHRLDLFGLGGITSSAVVPGLPLSGPLDLDFPEPPVLVSHGVRDPYRLGDVLEWQLSDSDVTAPALELMVRLFAADSRNQLMTLFAPPGTTSAQIPLPPSDVDAEGFLELVARGQVQTCELDEARSVCLRNSSGAFFDVLP